MQSIALPKKIQILPGSEPHRSSVVIEPLFPGYGTTVGNALRRVLLSSLPGAAVIGVKIEGADHEFQALPKIKEDVLQILLNLKKLSIKVHSEETVRLELDAHGEKEVKAKKPRAKRRTRQEIQSDKEGDTSRAEEEQKERAGATGEGEDPAADAHPEPGTKPRVRKIFA